MSTWWKYLVALGLVVPIAAYVAGSLTASADSPRPRETIVIEDKHDKGRVEDGDDESGPGDDSDDDRDDDGDDDRGTDDGGSQRAAGTDDGAPAGGAGTAKDTRSRGGVPADDSVDGAADSISSDT